MQIAILVVLILILVSISPWVLALAAAIAVAYGAWVIVTGLAFFLVFIVAVCYTGFKANRPVISAATEAQIERVNLEARRREAEEAACSASSEPAQEKPARLIACRSCSAEIQKFSMFCPVCGKKPI